MRAILITALITVCVAVGATYWLTHQTPVDTGYCLTQVGTTDVETDLEQSKWASQMAAIGIQRGLPPRATTIAIATAYQESKMRNIDYGDRDSLGLFQQRPSQGWGSAEQISDPVYAINAFYDGLEKVSGYATMEITAAAQAVQRSAFPTAYAQHEANARALASALRGYSPSAFACTVDERPGSFSALKEYLGKFWPGAKISTTDDTHSIAVTHMGEAANVYGWALSHFLVANSAEFGIASVSFDDMQWRASDHSPMWTPTEGIGQKSVRFTMND